MLAPVEFTLPMVFLYLVAFMSLLYLIQTFLSFILFVLEIRIKYLKNKRDHLILEQKFKQ